VKPVCFSLFFITQWNPLNRYKNLALNNTAPTPRQNLTHIIARKRNFPEHIFDCFFILRLTSNKKSSLVIFQSDTLSEKTGFYVVTMQNFRFLPKKQPNQTSVINCTIIKNTIYIPYGNQKLTVTIYCVNGVLSLVFTSRVVENFSLRKHTS